MRIYKDFPEALAEVHRDLVEMGIQIHPLTYQDKYIADNPDFETLELQNYNYTVIHPIPAEVQLLLPDQSLRVPTQPWADTEFQERISGIEGHPVNPGSAWSLRSNVWETFRDKETGKFAYTYSERFAMNHQVSRIINRLLVDRDSRQLWIAVWHPDDITQIGGISRVPCSLGYQLQYRQGRLNMHYIQRSADFMTHFVNDVYLASLLHMYIADCTELPLGTFSHTVFSLHLFKKDAGGVF